VYFGQGILFEGLRVYIGVKRDLYIPCIQCNQHAQRIIIIITMMKATIETKII